LARCERPRRREVAERLEHKWIVLVRDPWAF
jgi:hypothetical protein